MQIEELKSIAREKGIVGAGGAGFPAYAKMTDKADVIILNCIECEPLLKLHRQLLAVHTEEIIMMLEELRQTLGATEAIVGIKSEYKTTIQALKEVLVDYPKVRIYEAPAAYPMGDEVVLIYESTGRRIKPGGLPIDENVVVYNVETMYNLYRAVHLDIPVTNKIVSIVGEIDTPLTIRVPLGTTVKEAVALAGNITTANPAYLLGGPMMGYLGTERTVITKTTNAIIILPENHKLIARMARNLSVERRKAASVCCQCRACTDLCSRYSLGHPIEPHRVMRAVADHNTSDLNVYTNALYCSGCGICEEYACPQSLSPKFIIQAFKAGLRKAGVPVERKELAPIVEDRDLRKLPVARLASRLGLTQYNVPAPFQDTTPVTKYVKISMSQHIGAPATPLVVPGEQVKKGQKIGEAKEGLSVCIHCSIDGIVEKVTDKEVVVRGN